MSSITLRGRVDHINQQQQNGNFLKHLVLITINLDTQYPQLIEVEFSQDRISLLQNVQIGQTYDFGINVRGMPQPWQDSKDPNLYRAFISLSVWKVDPAGQAQPAQGFGGAQQPAQGFGAPQTTQTQQPSAMQPNQGFGLPAQPQTQQPSFPSSNPQGGNPGFGGVGFGNK